MFLSLFFTILRVLDDALKTLGVNKKQSTLIVCLEKKIVIFPRKKKKKKSKGCLFAEKMKEKRDEKKKLKSLVGTCFNFVTG